MSRTGKCRQLFVYVLRTYRSIYTFLRVMMYLYHILIYIYCHVDRIQYILYTSCTYNMYILFDIIYLYDMSAVSIIYAQTFDNN